MTWLFKKIVRYLLGPAAVDGITDDMMDSLILAMNEESARVQAQDT